MAAPNVNIRRWSALLVPAMLGAAAVVAACSSSNSSNPTPPVYSVEGGVDAGVDVTQPQDAAPSQDAAPEAAPVDAGPPEDAVACTADSGCWSCTPQTPTEFLNQCTSSQCSPFNNAQRLPDYDGSLPPLQ
jgi:hypothetical protein